MSSSTRFVGVLENAMLAAGDVSCIRMAIAATACFFRGGRGGFGRGRLAEATEHFRDNIANQDFIDSTHDINSAPSFLENLFAQNIHRIDDTNNNSVYRGIF